jgi:hypothetical protein
VLSLGVICLLDLVEVMGVVVIWVDGFLQNLKGELYGGID